MIQGDSSIARQIAPPPRSAWRRGTRARQSARPRNAARKKRCRSTGSPCSTGGRHAARQFHLDGGQGEIVGVAGVEGNGQSELAACSRASGADRRTQSISRDSEITQLRPNEITAAGIGIVPEDRHAVGCIAAMSVAENMYLNRLEALTASAFCGAAASQAARELMKRFDVRAAGPEMRVFRAVRRQPAKGGAGARDDAAKSVFLLAAQPTRGLDVGAVAAVYGHIRAACARGAAVLLISSELDELLAVADRIVVLYRGRIMGDCAADPRDRERSAR